MFIWDENFKKIGSLVLGHDKLWSIHIDKSDRQYREKEEAEYMLKEAEREDSDSALDKERSTRERDLKIMEQIKASTLRRTQRERSQYDDM